MFTPTSLQTYNMTYVNRTESIGTCLVRALAGQVEDAPDGRLCRRPRGVLVHHCRRLRPRAETGVRYRILAPDHAAVRLRINQSFVAALRDLIGREDINMRSSGPRHAGSGIQAPAMNLKLLHNRQVSICWHPSAGG